MPDERPAGQVRVLVPFDAHVELLHRFLDHRSDIVERIQGALNAQREPIEHLRDSPRLANRFEDCFFSLADIPRGQSRLRGELDEVHWRSGFKPRDIPGLHNGLADPAEMMVRAFFLWQQTRWPGRNGRVRYAHTLFNLYVIRCLELLSLRLWDPDGDGPDERMSLVQRALDRLWDTSPDGQPVFVRDARWLIHMAQSPATDDVGAYFDVARRVAETLAEPHRIAIHKAGVRMTAGHLRSQIRYHSLQGAVPIDEAGLMRRTRVSNALDFGLLVQELVPLLEAYETACHANDGPTRVDLADAICQGVSPDPELFLNRVDLLGAHTMIEHLFVTTGPDGQPAYSPLGLRHVRLLHDYAALIHRVSKALHEDCRHFRPITGAYSPYGVLYGFSSDIIKHMALKALTHETVKPFGLEDVFVAGGTGSDKLAWVEGWRRLPHMAPDVERLFDYPQQFAEDTFDRVERTLSRRASPDGASAVAHTGRLVVVDADAPRAEPTASSVPELPTRHIRSSDRDLVAAQRAEHCDEAQLLSDRREGRCILTYKSPGGWVGISKSVLTDVLGAGHDATIRGLPPVAADVLTLMCPSLVVLSNPGPG